MELSIAYEITGPDGTRAVVGNCDEALADVDFVGYLDPENGITGLLDTAEVRETSNDLVGGDGATHGAFWLGRRPGTIQGLLLPNAEMPTVNAAEAKLKRATRALRADGTLKWTPSGDTIERMLRFRRQQPVRITGRRPKQFQAALVSADPYVLSAAENTVTLTPTTSAGEIGISSPISSPLGSALDVTAATVVTNAGNAPTWPRFVIEGPIQNPTIVNNTTGQETVLQIILAATEQLYVYPELGAVLFDGEGRYSAVADSNEWWQLGPGATDVRLLAAAYSAGAELTIHWRHAWE